MADPEDVRGRAARRNPFDEMWMGLSIRKAVGPLALVALLGGGLAACGSGAPTTTTREQPPVSASTADHLAKLSSRIANDLDAGETCSAAMAADDLKAAVQGADLANTIRPGIEEVASRLVDEVNCPPPPPPPPPAEKKKPKHEGGNQNQQGGQKHPKPPGLGGKLPPGQAKLKGE